MELGGPNTLLWPSRDPHVVDLTTAHPGGIAMLLSGRDARLSDLVREHGARVVLVVGGSLGARTINEAIGSRLQDWEASGVALLWQTGVAFATRAKELCAGHSFPHWSDAFIQRMDLAYGLADVVISRAGASAISELCLLGKPTILVPSPNVAEDHQTKNALALSLRGAAILIPDADARRDLTPRALALVADEPARRALSEEILRLALPSAADRIVDEIESLVP